MDSGCRQAWLPGDHFATDLSTCIDCTPPEKQNSSCYRSSTSNLLIFWLFDFSSFNLVIYFIKIISNLAPLGIQNHPLSTHHINSSKYLILLSISINFEPNPTPITLTSKSNDSCSWSMSTLPTCSSSSLTHSQCLCSQSLAEGAL